MPTSDAALIPRSDKAIGRAQQDATPNAASIPPAARTIFAVSGPIRESGRDGAGVVRSSITGNATPWSSSRLKSHRL